MSLRCFKERSFSYVYVIHAYYDLIYHVGVSWCLRSKLRVFLSNDPKLKSRSWTFFIVAPHWYFRPHMGLLTVCAQHYEGFILIWCFFIYRFVSCRQFINFFNQDKFGFARVDYIPMRYSRLQQSAYIVFVGSILYCGGTLPCGRFLLRSRRRFFLEIYF